MFRIRSFRLDFYIIRYNFIFKVLVILWNVFVICISYLYLYFAFIYFISVLVFAILVLYLKTVLFQFLIFVHFIKVYIFHKIIWFIIVWHLIMYFFHEMNHIFAPFVEFGKVSRNCTEDGWSEMLPHYFDVCPFNENGTSPVSVLHISCFLFFLYLLRRFQIPFSLQNV